MDWGKTKTIFIAVFLVLDLFLAVMFFNKYGASRFEVIQKSSIEEKLKTDGVKYKKMPADSGELTRITAQPKTFTEQELMFLTKQEVLLQNNQTELYSMLDAPYDTDGATREKIISFVKNNVLLGDQYDYWDRNREQDKNEVIFYQKIKGNKLFENASGMLKLQLNQNGDIISYTQTMLINVEKTRDEEVILPALDALDALYRNGLVQPDSEISEAELGYYTIVKLTESQVLSPTWYFQLKKENKIEEIYVNAFDGSIYQKEKEL